MKENVPREVGALNGPNVVIFTDACYEKDSSSWPCGLGRVICCGNVRRFFSLPVGQHVRQVLGESLKN